MNKIMIISSKTNEIDFYRKCIINNIGDSEVHFVQNKEKINETVKRFSPNIVIIINNYSFDEVLFIQKSLSNYSMNLYTILVSEYCSFEYMRKAMQNRIRDFILKPASEEDIVNRIEIAIDILESYSIQDEIVEEYSDFIKKSIKYIKENYNSKLTLEKVANYVHLNPQYFSRIFKNETRISFTDYLNRIKIEKAIELLVSTSYPAYKIAVETGFSDASYFNKIFVEVMGMTPCKYRRKMKL